MADLLRQNVTATAVAVGRQVFLHSVTLTPAAAKSTVRVQTGGSGGAILMNLQAAADGGSVTWTCGDPCGVPSDGIYVTLTGSGASSLCEVSGI